MTMAFWGTMAVGYDYDLSSFIVIAIVIVERTMTVDYGYDFF